MSGVKGTDVKPSQCLNYDINQQKNFIKYYISLSTKPETTVRFFDRSDYYSVHGPDAFLAASSLFKTESRVKCMSPGGDVGELAYLCINRANFETFLRELLLVKNYRVEVFTNKGNKPNDWILEYKGSPGNLIQFEDFLFNSNENAVIGNCIIAINVKFDNQRKHIGVACIDQNERTFSIIEFDDDTFFVELEALVVILGPKECILTGIDGEYCDIKNLMERNNVMITIRQKKDFQIDKSDLIQDLNRLLCFEKGQQESAHTLPEVSKTMAMSALAAAIKYLNLINDENNIGQFKLDLLNLNRFVHLNSAAVSALNLLPVPGTSVQSPAYHYQSILGVLDRCLTAQGHRLMAQWIKQPLRDEAMIRDRHDIVECFVDSIQTRDNLRGNFMKKMPDIMILSKKLIKKKANLQDVYRIYQVLNRIPKVLDLLSSLGNTTVNNILQIPMNDTLEDLSNLKRMVEQVLDSDGVGRGEYLVKPAFDDELREMRSAMDEIDGKMSKQLNKVASELDLSSGSTIKLEYISHHGYHFRIAMKDEVAIRQGQKYKVLDAIKGGVRFTTEKLSELNDEFLQIKVRYEDQQQCIVDEVIRVAAGYLQPLSNLNHQIAQLDCLLSFAVAAATAIKPYVRPKMFVVGSGTLNLKQLRHPCLELQDDVTFIANDCFFKRNDTEMYIITGPNMGGKSTYIRSVGVAVLMAHVGSFVPCDSADITIVDSILARIGADDNINKGLSTFMVEMIETSAIIKTATENSLVVIDELGRGTSTYEGCGIAWSIAEYLVKETKCFSLFATHFHEITELSNQILTAKSSHMHAIADNDNFVLLYEVRPGVMDKSFGIHVAKLANFPKIVVETAQQLYDNSEDHFGHLKKDVDEEIIQYFDDELKKLIVRSDLTEEDAESFMKNVNEKMKGTNSEYLKNAFTKVSLR